MTRKLILTAALVLAVAVLAAQAFQPDRTNPPVNPAQTWQAVAQPAPEVAGIVQRSCRDCHTNETVWPWYSRISPMSWMVAGDVKQGRSKLNFSRWDQYSPEMSSIRLADACEEVRKGAMPLPHYTPLHPEAKLTPKDVDTLCSAQ
jgi:hypothetical protein